MSRAPVVHLINPMCHVGGSELHVIDTYRVLRGHGTVRVWATRQPAPELLDMAPIERLRPWRLAFPRDGVFVFIGAYFHIGRWLRWTRPSRTILLYNIPDADALRRTLETLSVGGERRVELLYASEEMQRQTGLPGLVEDSPIDLALFKPRETSGALPFTVGRASRDTLVKFADSDPALFAALAERGVRVRIIGGTCLRKTAAARSGVELLPVAPPRELPAFLQSLDCFIYRTSPLWPEAFGRVVAEAMACGVPVIVQSTVGASEHLVHGVNGFVADSDEEILTIVDRLRADPAFAAAVGRAARATMEQRYGPAQMRKAAGFFFSLDPQTPQAVRMVPRMDSA